MTVMRLHALAAVVLGALLAAGSWDGLYDALGFPIPKPAIYAQLAGVMLFVFAYLFWTRDSRPLAGPSAAGTAVSALLILVWLVSGRLDTETLGTVLVVVIVAVLAVLALAEARLARE